MIAGFGSSDVLWYVVAALAAAFALAFASGIRRFMRWGIGRIKSEFLDWFQEAIDEHVEPQLTAIKDEALLNTNNVRDEVASTAAAVKEELRLHTQEEGTLVKVIVDNALKPIIARLDSLKTNGDT